ncbi:MAG: Spy/CpxP family protein refolding chaperone [Blastocatellia bacterium]
MKKAILLLISPILLVAVFATVTSAQETPPAEPVKREFVQPAYERPNLLRELGLTQDQIRQIRRMNAENKALMNDAQRRLREANRDLDMAIYSDSLNENEVAERLKTLQIAQAEVAKLRFNSELAIRKVLTPEQLVRFRELRLRFNQVRENLQRRMRNQEQRRQIQGPNQRQLPPRQL